LALRTDRFGSATFLIEFDFDQTIRGEIRAEGAGTTPKRINK